MTTRLCGAVAAGVVAPAFWVPSLGSADTDARVMSTLDAHRLKWQDAVLAEQCGMAVSYTIVKWFGAKVFFGGLFRNLKGLGLRSPLRGRSGRAYRQKVPEGAFD